MVNSYVGSSENRGLQGDISMENKTEMMYVNTEV